MGQKDMTWALDRAIEIFGKLGDVQVRMGGRKDGKIRMVVGKRKNGNFKGFGWGGTWEEAVVEARKAHTEMVTGVEL